MSKLTPEQINRASKKLSEAMDYPWDHMPDEGRENMRDHVRAIEEIVSHGYEKRIAELEFQIKRNEDAVERAAQIVINECNSVQSQAPSQSKSMMKRLAVQSPAQVQEPKTIHNPWKESLANCITGDNYLRASEYQDLIDELDGLYLIASQHPVAAQVRDEAIIKMLVELDNEVRDDEFGLPIGEDFGFKHPTEMIKIVRKFLQSQSSEAANG